MAEFGAWENFYVIVGSASGALIGLQFIFVTLIANRPRLPTATAGAAFATPTIVHFTMALLVSALMSAPWTSIGTISLLWGLVGAGGILYVAYVLRYINRATATYRPVLEDWLFHVLLPFVAYGLLLVVAFAASSYLQLSLFTVGTSSLILLFIGIHNSWDAVTYYVFTQLASEAPKQSSANDKFQIGE